jgi:hypothetical protein
MLLEMYFQDTLGITRCNQLAVRTEFRLEHTGHVSFVGGQRFTTTNVPHLENPINL